MGSFLFLRSLLLPVETIKLLARGFRQLMNVLTERLALLIGPFKLHGLSSSCSLGVPLVDGRQRCLAPVKVGVPLLGVDKDEERAVVFGDEARGDGPAHREGQ